MTADDEFVDWASAPSPFIPPPMQTLQWVEQQVHAEIVGVEELVGGLSSAVHRLRVVDAPSVVLRRFTLADWIEREPHIPHDEARNLTMLGGLDLGVATPTLIAADPDAQHCDVPAIVMTEVAGQPVIDPVDPVAWAERMAHCLARIHEQPAVPQLSRYHRWDSPNRPLPIWTADPTLWRHAIATANVELPAHPDGFLHRDYHPNNIHWVDGEICAVVDWLGACTGPLAGDLSHCRWNIAILHSAGLADHFLAHYRILTGYSEDVTLFDLATVLSGPVGPFPTHAWNALGRNDLTSDRVARLIDAWLGHLLAPN